MGKPKTVKPDMEEDFVRRWNSPESTSSIAESLGCNPSTVLDTARRLGLSPRKLGKPLHDVPNEDVKEIVQQWDSGTTLRQLRLKWCLSYDVLARVLITEGREVQRYAHHPTGVDHPTWSGGKIRHGSGYILVRVYWDDPMFCMVDAHNYVPEHRLIMARELNRPLERSETVHHINGIRDDNRLDNLQLRSGAHGKGVIHQCLDCGSHNIKSIPIADDCPERP